MMLYAELKQMKDGEKTFVLSFDVEKDAKRAGLSIDEYINETARINPQFKRVYVK